MNNAKVERWVWGVLPVERGKVGQQITQRINMQVSQLMAFHQRGDQTAAGFGESQPFELQHRVGPGIQPQQIAGARKRDPFAVAEFILREESCYQPGNQPRSANDTISSPPTTR